MDNLERMLQDKTSAAIHMIAREIDREKEIQGKAFPEVIYSPICGSSYTSHTGEFIVYDTVDEIRIFEEASHALHIMLNDGLKDKLKAMSITSDTFFTVSLMETFAYFCTKLFCDREGGSFQKWKSEVEKDNGYAVNKLKSIKRRKGLKSEKIIEYHPELRDTFTKKRIIRYAEKMYQWLDNSKDMNGTFKKEMDKLVQKASIRGRMVAFDRDYSNKLLHCIGYELGESLYTKYPYARDNRHLESIVDMDGDSLGLFHKIHLDLIAR